MTPLPIQTSGEASKGGFQGIDEVYGLLVDVDVVPAPDGWDTTKDQVLVTMEDAKILKMAEGEDEFDLNDNKYSFYITYCDKALSEGKRPTKNSAYVKAFLASFERAGVTMEEKIGQYVTFKRVPTVLFTRTDKETQEKEDITTNCFTLVGTETVDSDSTKTYIRDLLVGLTQKAALKQLVLDPKAKQFPEFKVALKEGTLEKMVGLKIEGTKFAVAVEE